MDQPDVDLRDAGGLTFMQYLEAQFPVYQRDIEAGVMPSSVFGLGACAHPVALVKMTDAIATCDGCGRVFELAEFGRGKT